jgi:hypothetical protein
MGFPAAEGISMDEIRVDRLTLKLSGLTEAQGRNLAMLITEGLAAATLKPDAAATQQGVKVELKASASGDLGPLSDRVVSEVLRQLERSL